MKKNEPSENNVNIIQIDATNLFKCQKCKIYLHQIYKLILLTMTIMCLVLFAFNNGLLKLFEGFMTINIYSLLIKSDIYFSSICLLDCCRISNFGGNESLEENKYRLLYRGKELIDHYIIFSKTINNFVDKHQLNDIYTFLSTKTEYEYLLKNYNANKVQSNLLDELFLFHYSITKASGESTFQTCRMRDFFAYKKYLNYRNDTSLPETPPLGEEQILYYILQNIMTTYKETLEGITTKTNSLINTYTKNCKNYSLVYNSVIFALSIILFVVIVILLINDKRDMRILLSILYSRGNNEFLIENDLKLLQNVIEEFSEENCEKFEENKRTNETEEIKDKKKISNLHSHLTKSKISHLSTKPVNTMKKISKKNLKQENNNSQKLATSSLPSTATIPTILNYSMWIVALFIFFFVAIEFVNIVIMYKMYNELSFMNIISINFLDRIPKICELLLYGRISMLLNDIYFITVNSSLYDTKSYSNYYNVTFNKENNIVFELLKESEYAFLYYQSMQITDNIKLFITKETNSYLFQQIIKFTE